MKELESIHNKFKSKNSVEVSQATISRDEYHKILMLERELRSLKRELDSQYPKDFFSRMIYENSPYAPYLFQWVPYKADLNQFRLKMFHDVKTFDGREAFEIWPNGASCGPFKDSEVEFIRISKKEWSFDPKDPKHPWNNV